MHDVQDYTTYRQSLEQCPFTVAGLEEATADRTASSLSFALAELAGASLKVDVKQQASCTALRLRLAEFPRDTFVRAAADIHVAGGLAVEEGAAGRVVQKAAAVGGVQRLGVEFRRCEHKLPAMNALLVRPEEVTEVAERYSDGRRPLGEAKYEVVAGQICFDPVPTFNRGRGRCRAGQSQPAQEPPPARVVYLLPSAAVDFQHGAGASSGSMEAVLLDWLEPFTAADHGSKLRNGTTYKVTAQLQMRFSNRVLTAMSKRRSAERLAAFGEQLASVATPQVKRPRAQ